MDTHRARIDDQFTRQASLFQASHRSAADAIEQALSAAAVTAGDTVLDVACGPGVLGCAFATRAAHVTGIDITAAMLEQARRLQSESGVGNVTWRQGDVYDMPFAAETFSLVITRYAFHHLERPGAVLREMARVCVRGGKVVVIDSAPPPEKADAFNRIERLRDPSHTQALTAAAVFELVAACDLAVENTVLYAWEVPAKGLLARSFPADGDRERVLRHYEADVGVDNLAMRARHLDGELHVTFPTLITVARKP